MKRISKTYFCFLIFAFMTLLGPPVFAQERAQSDKKEAQIHRFSTDENDVKQLYNLLSRGARPIEKSQPAPDSPKNDLNQKRQLRDKDDYFSNRGQFESDMFEYFQSMRERMQRMFESPDMQGDKGAQGPQGGGPFSHFFKNALNIADDPIETVVAKEETTYTIDLTKVDPNSLKIDIKDKQISIQGQSRIEHKEEGQYSSSTSISISSFNRAFPLPEGVQEGHVKLEQNEKVIKIVVPNSPRG